MIGIVDAPVVKNLDLWVWSKCMKPSIRVTLTIEVVTI